MNPIQSYPKMRKVGGKHLKWLEILIESSEGVYWRRRRT